jgi:hypothetical protein
MGNKSKSFALIMIFAIVFSCLDFQLVRQANAQPTPPDVPTLGPVVYYENSQNNETIISSPANGGKYPNPVFLNFSVTTTSMLGQFGNIGYSLDGGIINSVSSFINKTVDFNPVNAPAWYFYNTTIFASIVLPPFTEGVHNVTVYYGWQYLGNPSVERFEVQSWATSNFTVGEISIQSPSPTNHSPSPNQTTSPTNTIASPTPTPTVPEFQVWTILLALILIVSTSLLVYFKKHELQKM